MAGTTSSIISNLLSSLERLSQFMPTCTTLAASSSSSIAQEDVTAAEVNSIQERLMEDLSRLSRMLQRIQAVLHDAEEREIYDKAIQLWLNELREIAYDAEDVLDKYDYEIIKTQLKGITAVAEVEPSLKRKRVDDDDIYGYQHWTSFDEASDLDLCWKKSGWASDLDLESDGSSSNKSNEVTAEESKRSSGGGETGAGRSVKSPADFLKSIRGRPVVVKLNSGVDYRGILACLDGYMNIAMEQTEEYVNGQLKNKYGDAFIRGNNVLYISASKRTVGEGE